MPRRISDYPDAFAGWNLISSLGSIISVGATWLFLHILYVQLVEGNATSRYPWLTVPFNVDTLQSLLTRAYNSLEWCLNSPPKPHAFISLPIQSSFETTLMVLKSSMGPNEFAVVLDQIVSGGIFVSSLFIKTMYSADTLSPDMLEPITMINKPVDIVDNIDRTYAGVEYINENLQHVRNLHIDGPLNFDHSTTLRNV